MKKILFLLFAAAAIAACENDDENFTPDTGSYSCTLAVTDNATGTETNRAEGVVCSLDEQPDQSVSLTMKDVKFTANTPEPVKTIVFPKLTSRNEGGTTWFESAEEIVPEIGGTPYKNYRIRDFSCSVSDNAQTFRLSFTCVNTGFPPLNHKAEFNGILIK